MTFCLLLSSSWSLLSLLTSVRSLRPDFSLVLTDQKLVPTKTPLCQFHPNQATGPVPLENKSYQARGIVTHGPHSPEVETLLSGLVTVPDFQTHPLQLRLSLNVHTEEFQMESFVFTPLHAHFGLMANSTLRERLPCWTPLVPTIPSTGLSGLSPLPPACVWHLRYMLLLLPFPQET